MALHRVNYKYSKEHKCNQREWQTDGQTDPKVALVSLSQQGSGELWLFSPIFERWKFNSILSSTYPIATALYTTEVARARRHTTGAL